MTKVRNVPNVQADLNQWKVTVANFWHYPISYQVILKETRNATKSNVNFCVFSRRFLNYYFDCHNRELRSENITFNDEFNDECKKAHKK